MRLPDDAEGRCLEARARAELGPLSDAEVAAWLALLDDRRTAPDPLDPPSYDWGGGGPVAGGSEMQVSSEVAALLRTRGGDALARAFGPRLRAPGARSQVAALAVELLGPPHPLIAELLADADASVREAIAGGVANQPYLSTEALTALAPALLDPHGPVVRHAVAAFDKAFYGHEPAIAALPPDALARATQLDARILIAAVSRRWSELELTPADCGHVVARKVATAERLEALLAAQPALAGPLFDAVRRRFESERVGSRYDSAAQLAAFASKEEAFTLFLTELRARPSAADVAARFVARDRARLSPVIAAVLAGMRVGDQHGALGLRALIQVDPPAFAAAFPAERRDDLRRALRALPDSTEGQRLLASMKML